LPTNSSAFFKDLNFKFSEKRQLNSHDVTGKSNISVNNRALVFCYILCDQKEAKSGRKALISCATIGHTVGTETAAGRRPAAGGNSGNWQRWSRYLGDGRAISSVCDPQPSRTDVPSCR
jgi:hypothetical protein